MKHKVLKYDLIEAHFAGVENHPQAEMKRLGLDGYYRAVPESIGDCWFFLFDTWPQVELPSYLSKIEIDDNKAPELKMKPGDKVWFVLEDWCTVGEIVCGEIECIDEHNKIAAVFNYKKHNPPRWIAFNLLSPPARHYVNTIVKFLNDGEREMLLA